MSTKIDRPIPQAFNREFETVGNEALRLLGKNKLTKGDMAVLATLLDREFGPTSRNQLTRTPIQMFNWFLDQRQR